MKPMTLLLIGIVGFIVLDIGIGITSLPISVYGGMAIGFMFGALARSKDN